MFFLGFLVGAFLLYQGLGVEAQKREAQALTQEVAGEMEDLLAAPQAPEAQALDVLALYREHYKSPAIQGVLDIGPGLIREPLMFADDLYYLRRTPSGQADPTGTVFAYGGDQKSPEDNYTVYYGHSMTNGTRFGPLIDHYQKNREALEEAKIYSQQGARNLELWALVIIDIDLFEKASLTSYEGLVNFIQQSEEKNLVVYQKGGLEPEDFLVSLSTCATSDAQKRLVAIYKGLE